MHQGSVRVEDPYRRTQGEGVQDRIPILETHSHLDIGLRGLAVVGDEFPDLRDSPAEGPDVLVHPGIMCPQSGQVGHGLVATDHRVHVGMGAVGCLGGLDQGGGSCIMIGKSICQFRRRLIEEIELSIVGQNGQNL